MIVDAAHQLLRENDYEDVSVAAILAGSGLSTRSFYRHFESKDELLVAMFRQNAEQMSRHLEGRVAAADSTRRRLEAWLDGMLRLRFDARVARRVAFFGAPSARRAAGYEAAEQQATELLSRPLLEVLEAGRSDGSFPRADPVLDARSIYALVWGVLRAEPPLTREVARRHVLRFALAGLGAEPGQESGHVTPR